MTDVTNSRQGDLAGSSAGAAAIPKATTVSNRAAVVALQLLSPRLFGLRYDREEDPVRHGAKHSSRTGFSTFVAVECSRANRSQH